MILGVLLGLLLAAGVVLWKLAQFVDHDLAAFRKWLDGDIVAPEL